MLGCGITQVVGQQCVDHHALEGQAVAQQDQPVVLGVLQRFGVIAAGQPRGQGGEHAFQRQLLDLFRGEILRRPMADRDVGDGFRLVSPADTDAHQLGLERVQGRGLGVECNRGGGVGDGHQPLHQGSEVGCCADQLGPQHRIPVVSTGVLNNVCPDLAVLGTVIVTACRGCRRACGREGPPAAGCPPGSRPACGRDRRCPDRCSAFPSGLP